MRYCLKPGCPELVEGRRVARCPQHEAEHRDHERRNWKSNDPTGRPIGREWRTLRAQVLRLAHGQCAVPGCPTPAVQVDHIVPVAFGGTSELANLQALCEFHHHQKSMRDALEGKRRKREQR